MKVIDLESIFDLDKLVKYLVSVLRDGGLIVVPTDTCYGVLARADSLPALAKLRKLKELPVAESVPFLVSSLEQIKSMAVLDEVGLELIEDYLPGNLTVVLDGAGSFEGSLVGFRFPEHTILNSIANVSDFGLVITSAAKFGKAPVYSIEQLTAQYQEELEYFDLVVEAGVLDLNPLTTVVRVDDNQIEILREGLLTSLLVTQFSHKSQ